MMLASEWGSRQNQLCFNRQTSLSVQRTFGKATDILWLKEIIPREMIRGVTRVFVRMEDKFYRFPLSTFQSMYRRIIDSQNDTMVQIRRKDIQTDRAERMVDHTDILAESSVIFYICLYLSLVDVLDFYTVSLSAQQCRLKSEAQ